MPRYDYACVDCEKSTLTQYQRDLTQQEYDELVLFETSHSMNPTAEELKEAVVCPRCNSTNCVKSFLHSRITSYVKGNGYLDKAGARRDMNLYHLTQDDPYSEYRQAGEVEDMKIKLKRSGQHNPNTKHFQVSNKEMESAVRQVVNSNTEI